MHFRIFLGYVNVTIIGRGLVSMTADRIMEGASPASATATDDSYLFFLSLSLGDVGLENRAWPIRSV